MTPRAAFLIAASLIPLAAAPATADAAVWPARTVATSSAAYDRAIDVTPGGTVRVLLERVSGKMHTLELHTGSRVVDLARGRGSYDDAQLGHDAHGGYVAAWTTVASAHAARRAFVFADGAVQQLPTATRGVYGLSLAVAPSGEAVVATVHLGGELRVARRPAGGRFAAPQTLTTQAGFIPRVAITPDGEAVVAYPGSGTGLEIARSAAPGQPFAAPVTVTPERTPDDESEPDFELNDLAVTDDGMVVVGGRTTVRRLAGGSDRRASIITWRRGTAAPDAPVTVSTQPSSTGTQVTAKGARAFLAWRQAPAGDDAAGRLGLGALTSSTGPITRLVRPAGGPGARFSFLELVPGRTGARVAFSRRLQVFSAPVYTSAALGRVDQVTPAADRASFVHLAEARGRGVAIWTRMPGPDRVRIAVQR